MSIGLYEAGMESNEEVTKTIVQRVCTNNARFSAALIGMVRMNHNLNLLLLLLFMMTVDYQEII